MNFHRFQALFEGINSAARKVYNATPISETWDVAALSRELERTTGRMDYRTAHGCLAHLVEVGLVLEPTHGMYRRTPVRTPEMKTPEPKEPNAMTQAFTQAKPQAVPVVAPVAKVSPMDILGALAIRARDLQTDIENAALAIQEQLDANEKDMEKFRQLQTILKGLGA